MVFYFKKSRNTTLILTTILILAGYVILHLFSKELSKQRYTYILIPVISIYISLYISKLIAYKLHQEVLLLLYKDLDINKFITEAEKINNLRLSKKEKCSFVLHLSNGYMAAGEFNKARNILLEYMPLAKKVGANLEFSSNIISALIQGGELKEADADIRELKREVGLIKDKGKNKDNIYKTRLQKTLAYQQACLETLKGSTKYKEILEKDYLSSKSIYHKINVSRYLIETYHKSGDIKKIKEIVKDVFEYGNQHYLLLEYKKKDLINQ